MGKINSKDDYKLDNILDRQWSYDDIEYWTNPKDKVVNAIIEYNDKRSRLRAGILIVKADKVLLGEEKGQEGEFSLPGGGLDNGETPIDCAKREAQEEVYINVKNIRDTGYDYCECHSEVMDWVKKNIPENKWWYNYYTCLCIGEYDDDYLGKVNEVDKDASMNGSKRWYKIKEVINADGFKKQWKKALIDYGYYKPELNEDLKDDAKEYFGVVPEYYSRVGFYINTDGTILDGSGEKLGNENGRAQGLRVVDHREVASIFKGSISGGDAMIAYMNEGNIRWLPEINSFELIKEPTQAQYNTMMKLIAKARDFLFYIEIDNAQGETIWNKDYRGQDRWEATDDIKKYFSGELTEDASIDKNIGLKVGNVEVGKALTRDYQDGEVFLTDFEIKPAYRGKGYGSLKLKELIDKYGVNSLSVNPENKIALELYKKFGFKQVGEPYYDENAEETVIYMQRPEKLTEDTRTQFIAKSRNAGQYKDQKFGKNRFERKRLSKMANAVKAFNQIDMNTFFKQDTLEVKIPVTGETDSYTVTVRMEGVCTEIAKNIKSNHNVLEFKTILQALTKVFNTANVYINCTCPDFKYRFNHWSVVRNFGTTDSAHDPGPGKGITNPHDDKGNGCKHVLLVLANGDWMMKVASVINNYIHYAEEKMQKAFLKVIFPKLYGTTAEDAIEAGLIPEDTNLETTKDVIDLINDYGRNRGKYQKGSNKNPITNTGGRAKKEPEKPLDKKEILADKKSEQAKNEK